MKAIYIYSKHKAQDLIDLAKIKDLNEPNILIKELTEVSADLKFLIRDTPSLIFAPDYLQGELVSGSDNIENLILGEYYRKLEEDELAVHNLESTRVGDYITSETTEAIDDYTNELIESEVL